MSEPPGERQGSALMYYWQYIRSFLYVVTPYVIVALILSGDSMK